MRLVAAAADAFCLVCVDAKCQKIKDFKILSEKLYLNQVSALKTFLIVKDFNDMQLFWVVVVDINTINIFIS